MNTIKKITVLLFVCICIALVACGEKKTKVSEEDLLKTVETMENDKVFSVNMIEIPGNVAKNYYTITEEDIEILKSVVGDGISGEEITIFKCKDESKCKEKIEKYINDKYETYISYLPEEANKIKEAIIKEYDGYVVVCIADDKASAKKILDKVGK